MITNFALSLSFDGIQLLHRVAGGWHLVGEVPVDADDLKDDLRSLRKKGLALDPSMRTKLVLPADQIKYITLDTAQTTDADIDDALAGATPYALDELVVDFERIGGRTYIAAVARETLQEAEDFAQDNDFAPVCFAAVPETFTFQREVFFGKTQAAADLLPPGETLAAEKKPVAITGLAPAPRVHTTKVHAPAPVDAPKVQSDVVLSPDLAKPLVVDDPAPDTIADMPAPLDAQDVAAVTDMPDALLKDVPSKDPTPVAEEVDAPTVGPDISVPAPVTAVDMPEPVADLFTHETAAASPIAQDAPKPVDVSATSEVTAPDVTDAASTPPPPAPKAPAPQGPVLATVNPDTPKAPQVQGPKRPVSRPVLVADLPPSPLTDKPVIVARSDGRSRKGMAAPVRTTPEKSNVGIMVGIAAAVLLLIGGVIWFMTSGDADAPTAANLPADPAPQTADIAQGAAPIIAAAPADMTPPTAAALGDIAPATARVPIILPQPQPIASPDTPADRIIIAEAVPPYVAPAEIPDAVPGQPVLRGQVLTPGEAQRIYAATGVWQRAPRMANVLRTTNLDGFVPPEGAIDPTLVIQPAIAVTGDQQPDLPFVAPANPPPPDAEFVLDGTGQILATPEGAATPDGAIVFAGSPSVTPPLRPALSAAQVDQIEILAPPPDGVVLISGPPSVQPPLRPTNLGAVILQNTSADDIANALAEAVANDQPVTPGGVALSGLRPNTRPTSITGAQQTASRAPGPGDLRPVLRPRGLAPAATQPDAPETTPDITAVIAAITAATPQSSFANVTNNAIAASRRPNIRPRNFATVVANARPAPTAAPAPRTQTASVAPPAATTGPQTFRQIPGGVARAATIDGAISLREINLIGVYGRPNARRALVRLSNGRYQRVEIGSALDGGQVTAIGDDALNYVKRGRTYYLEVPSG